MNRLATLVSTLLIIANTAAADPAVDSAAQAEDSFASIYDAEIAALDEADDWDLVFPSAETAADAAVLRRTVMSGAAFEGLAPGERAGLLVALADRTALDGDRSLARAMYEALEGSGDAVLHSWGTYMLAGLDFAAGSYAASADRYEEVCNKTNEETWREHACSMAGLARRLDELKTEGEIDVADDAVTP